MAKTAAEKISAHKPTVKKNDTPMTDAAKEKPLAIKAKAAKKTAKPLSKTEKKPVLSASALKRIATVKGRANGLILCIKQDVQAAVKGEVNPLLVQRMFKEMMDIVVEARESMYRDPK